MTHVHFIGIGGTGLSAIARLLIESGYSVSGSDRQSTPLAETLRTEGAEIYIGHHPNHVSGADLVIRSSAVQDDNPEVIAAQAAGIPVLKRADFLKQVMEGRKVIAVAGTHGKTTTSAMLAWSLIRLNQDPSFIVGGVPTNLGVNAHAGKGSIFVIEADEYDRMFLGLCPNIAVVTNIEHDHPDCYPTPEDFFQAFQDFTNNLARDGTLLTCGDDLGARRLHTQAVHNGVHALTYGINHSNGHSYTAKNLLFDPGLGGFAFDAFKEDELMAHITLQIPGRHNVSNALAVMAVADLLGLPATEVAQALSEFQGTGRRFDVRGQVGGIVIIDDYAHHPTEIQATLAAARGRFPQQEIWAVWQPHTFSRTMALFDRFITSFQDANHVLVTDVYAAREPIPDDFSAEDIVKAIQHPDVVYTPTLESAVQYLEQHLRPGNVLLVLSAGNADQISTQVLEGWRKRKVVRRKIISHPLSATFGERLLYNVPMANYTTAKIGGPADVLLIVHSSLELAQAASILWENDLPFIVLGGGSNILVSDAGIRGTVIVNRAKKVIFKEDRTPPEVWAEAGANLGIIARQSATRGLSGLEWACGIPGTLAGAVIGNAGAHGSDIASVLILAEILQRKDAQEVLQRINQETNAAVHHDLPTMLGEAWSPERLEYCYRSSLLKRQAASAVVLSAQLRLTPGSASEIQALMEHHQEHRRRTQPPGASMGCMFKNPVGDYAGRLIEAAGLKGSRVGNAEISSVHANFFVNHGTATAADVWQLIKRAQQTVAEKFAVELELEIELVGDWQQVKSSQ